MRANRHRFWLAASGRFSSATIAILLLWGFSTTNALAHDVSDAARERMQNGGILDYIWTGAEHMLTGYDHLLFLLGVMFFLTRFIDILKFVTAFTLGHTLTLVFATYAGISADHYLIDAVIAATVMYKGFENLDGFQRWIGFAAPSLLVMGVVIRAWQQTTVWEPVTRVCNGLLVFFGFLLLLYQLHGYLHEQGHVHGPATTEAAGVPHSHDGGPLHVH